MNPTTHVFVLGHDDQLNNIAIPNNGAYEKLHLHSLPDLKGDDQSCLLSETRFYLSSISELHTVKEDGIASVSWRYDSKYSKLETKLSNLCNIEPTVGTIWCAEKAQHNWFWIPSECFLGANELIWLAEKEGSFGLSFDSPAPWCNTFACHRDDFCEFLCLFRKVYDYFYDKYKLDLPYTLVRPEGHPDFKRKAGFVYERLAMCVWGCLGLTTKQIS
jgi:hypothetical protein